MTTKTYVDYTTPAVDAAWLNDVDRLLYDILNNPADDAGVVAGLGITASIAELNYVDGVTSAIQTQMDLKAPITNAVLVTPNLGTPSAGVLTNCTGTAAGLTAGTANNLPSALTGVVRVDAGVPSVDSDVTDIVSAASTTLAGKVELATSAETITGTDTIRAVTPDGFSAASFGYEQIWTTVTRVSGTEYTNTTGKPIMCLVSGTTDSGAAARVVVAPVVGGVAIQGQTAYDATGSAITCTVAFVVPPGLTYTVTVTTSTGTPSISGASELR